MEQRCREDEETFKDKGRLQEEGNKIKLLSG